MKKNILAILLLLSSTLLFAQDKNSKTTLIRASEFHITKPIRDIFAENPVDENKFYGEKESEDRKERKPQKFRFNAENDGYQYANDSTTIQTKMGAEPSLPTRLNIAGQTASGFRPFDPSGAVGPNHYVQMINSTTFKIYNKSSGSVILTGTLGNLWSPVTANAGDPIVMYDKSADRWFLAQFGSSTDKKIYIAVSTTNDPTGSYYTYTYVSSQFPDYLKFSVWADGYYMTSNQSTQKVFCFNRAEILAGTAAARSVVVNYTPPKSGFFVPLPGDAADGVLPPYGTPCPIISYSDNGWGTGYSDALNIYNMAIDWIPTTPTATITVATNLATAAFDASYNASWNDCPQPGTTQMLDGIGGVCMYRAQWKSWSGYNTIVLNWGVKISATQRSIKWCELRQNQTTGVWSVYQEGIYTPDAATRWMGCIAMDNNGSIGLSYIKSDATSIYPGLYYTGRRSADPLGTLPLTETLVAAGTGYQTGTNRVGDYAQTTLDPDGITFWNTSEYMGGTSGGSAATTRIFSYQITPIGNAAYVSITQTNGTNPSCPNTNVTFTATPTNGGSAPAYQWQVNGLNVGINSPTYTTNTLTNGQPVSCIMVSNLVGVTSNPATSNAITMNVNSIVTPTVSIALTSGSNPSCAGSNVTFSATPTNGGANPSYQWKVNGINAGTNSSIFSTTTLTNTQSVSCELTSNALCLTNTTATSNLITMTINAVANPTVSIAGNSTICVGTPTTFTANLLNGLNPSYQWKINGTNAGTNSSTFSTSALTNGQIISCTVNANSLCPSSATLGNAASTTLNTTTSDLACAYPTYYGNGRQQYLIKASELTASGFAAGNITSLGFTINSSAGSPAILNGYTIKIASTAATVLTTTFQAPTFTTVYGPINYTPTVNTLNTHNFTTPFAWNGTSNIIVDICFSNQVTGTAAYQNYQTTTTFVSTTYYQADGTTGAGACTQTTGTSGSKRPNMIFTIGGGTNAINSNAVTMIVNPLPIVVANNVSGCVGSSINLDGSPIGGTYSIANPYSGSSTTYTYSYMNLNGCSATSLPANVSVTNCSVTLNLKAFLQSYYIGASQMNPTLMNEGVGINPLLSDTIIVELHDILNPFALAYSYIGVIGTNGLLTCTFPGTASGNNYYMVVKHRNSIETWSANPITISNNMTYDFSNDVSKAYGNNMVDVFNEGIFSFYSGDMNQDGYVDGADYPDYDYDSSIGLFGVYVATDLNGDGYVDGADYPFYDMNSQLGVFVIQP